MKGEGPQAAVLQAEDGLQHQPTPLGLAKAPGAGTRRSQPPCQPALQPEQEEVLATGHPAETAPLLLIADGEIIPGQRGPPGGLQGGGAVQGALLLLCPLSTWVQVSGFSPVWSPCLGEGSQVQLGWTQGKGRSPVPIAGQSGVGHGFSSAQKLFQLLVTRMTANKTELSLVFETPQTWVPPPGSCLALLIWAPDVPGPEWESRRCPQVLSCLLPGPYSLVAVPW